MSNRGCRNHPDIFCYICRQYTLIRARNVIDGFVKKAYIAHFGIHIGDQDKPWAPRIVCINCKAYLREWAHGKRNGLLFGVPMV